MHEEPHVSSAHMRKGSACSAIAVAAPQLMKPILTMDITGKHSQHPADELLVTCYSQAAEEHP
jgi:hypothetical protein